MRIYVTRQRIEAGVQWNSRRCPIALATRSRAGPRTTVAVGADGAQAGNCRYVLPPEALDFIHRFDMGGSVAPAIFELVEIPR